ncbi:MAG: GTPase ObgE [Ignavibacteriae bacterium]|nr:GTPase ObgE [Ignavibacteriota bacterium]
MFIDEATIVVKAGNGGNGCISFRREKFVPKGGPDGGTGGRGGSVIIRADRQLTTLMDYRYQRHYSAKSGDNGQGANKTGRNGEDIILRVPCGTIIKEEESEKVLFDLVEDKDEFTVAKGGKGGRGNAEFATSTDQAPRKAEQGTKGGERTIHLELKLLADIGLVGFPNAGKSTLISRISAAKPKIADYPFTTLAPNLGIVRFSEYKSFVVADLPGLIEGAHDGRGLGIQFLRHIERTKVLVFLIDCFAEDVKEQYNILLNELELFNKELLKKPQIVLITKIDSADDETRERIQKIKLKRGIPVLKISSVSGEGLEDAVKFMWEKLRKNTKLK